MWEDSQITKKLTTVKRLIESNQIVLYGAGYYGRKAWSLLSKQLKEKVVSFAVTQNDGGKVLFGLPVKQIEELSSIRHDVLVIICVDKEKSEVIRCTLCALDFCNVMFYDEDAILYASAFAQLPRDTSWLLKDNSFYSCQYDEKSLCEKALSIGSFVKNIGTEKIVFKQLPFIWGGSGILDYALLRGLVLKYQLKSYLEVGTYIGASLTAVDDLVEHCFSVSVPPDDPRHMRFWCEARHMKDYSNYLVDLNKVTQFLEDSTYFDYSRTGVPIDLYFIDGDHSYRGVYIDTLKIFNHLNLESSFVVWHDCRTHAGIATEVVRAVHDAIGEYWPNFFVFDVACMCGIYIPPKYQKDFALASATDELTTYKLTLEQNK